MDDDVFKVVVMGLLGSILSHVTDGWFSTTWLVISTGTFLMLGYFIVQDLRLKRQWKKRLREGDRDRP